LFEFLERKKGLFVYTPLVVYWLLLLAATSLPAQDVPSLGISDKINHFVAYLILAGLLHLALIYQRKSEFLFNYAFAASVIIASAYGALDEIHQIYVPGRFAELLDWIADFLGAITGAFLVSILIKRTSYSPKFN
jgi:VanZ family protein